MKKKAKRQTKLTSRYFIYVSFICFFQHEINNFNVI